MRLEDACRALPGFEPTLTGGDGDGTQFCKYSSLRFEMGRESR